MSSDVLENIQIKAFFTTEMLDLYKANKLNRDRKQTFSAHQKY